MNAICEGNVTPEKERMTRHIFSASVKGFFSHVQSSKIIGTTLLNPHFPTSLGLICSLQGEYLGLFQNTE